MCRNFLIILLVFCGYFSISAQTPVADSLLAVGNYAKAVSAYQKIENPSAKTYYKIGAAFESTGNVNLALQNYKVALEKDNTLVEAASHYAKLLRHTKKYAKADSLFSNLISRYPDNPGFHYQLGLVRKLEKDSTYIEQFQKTLRLDPNHQKALYRCAFYNFQERKFDNVEVLCAQALKTYPENRKVQQLLIENAYVAKNHKTVAKRIEKLIDKNEAKKDDYEKLGYSYYQLQKLDKAIAAFKMVAKLDKTNLEAYYNLGLLYNLKGDYKKAKKYVQLTIFYKKQGLGKQYQTLGLAYKGLQNYHKAMCFFKLALKENPKLYRAQYELAVCADNYFEDLKTRLNYYKIVVNKFENTPESSPLIDLSQRRISDLTREIHFKTKSPPPPKEGF